MSDDTVHINLPGRRTGKTAALQELFNEQPGARTRALPAQELVRKPAGTESPYVLDVDRWSARKGAELARTWDELSKPADNDCNAIAPAPFSNTLAADCHEALFSPTPEAAKSPPAELQRAEWFKQLMATDDYRRLHRQTNLNTALSAIGAKTLADQWREYVAENPEPKPGDPMPGSDSESLSKALGRARSTSKALQECADNVETAQNTAQGLGMGDAGGEIDPQKLTSYFDLVRNDDFLRQLMDVAGRMRRLCQSLQRTKTQHGRDDMVGVELSGDLGRILPSELMQLTCEIPEIELLALDRVARRQALSRQYRGMEPLGRGPIVVVVDESGSMGGDPIITAKAIALALAWLARQQRRWIALVGFSGGTEGNRVAFPPGDMDQDLLLEWLTHFYGGGTTLDVPLHELPHTYWPEFMRQGVARGRTDVILITDAVVSCPNEMRDAYLRWTKAEQVKTYGIVIGEKDAGVLAEVCHQHWCIPTLEQGAAAIEGVLSI